MLNVLSLAAVVVLFVLFFKKSAQTVFPSGLKIGTNGSSISELQTGIVEYNGNLHSQQNDTIEVSFHTPFTNIPLVIVSPYTAQKIGGWWDHVICGVENVTQNGFTLTIVNTMTGPGYTDSFQTFAYIAINS